MSEWLLYIRKGEGRAKRRTKANILLEASLRCSRIDAAILAGTRGADYVLADWVLDDAAAAYGEELNGRDVLRRNLKASLLRLGYTPMANPRCRTGAWRLFGKDYTAYRKTSAAPLSTYRDIRTKLRS